MKKKANLLLVLDAYQVNRWHTEGYVLNRETVGHHTANVIAIIFFLFEDNPPLELVRAALHHDVPEKITGDWPAMLKWEFPIAAAASKEIEDQIMKGNALQHDLPEHLAVFLQYADRADAAIKAVDEIVAGNQHFLPALGRLLGKMKESLIGPLKDHVGAKQLYDAVLNNPFLNIEEITHETLQEKSNLH